MIIFNKVTKKFKDGSLVLKDVSFTVDRGEFVFLAGPSGAGKTTVSRLLIRELKPSKGRIFVDNQEITKLDRRLVPELRRKVGTAFQDYKLFYDWTAAENVSLPLQIMREKKEAIESRAKEVLGLVGLEGKEDFFPVQLSGGELQRVVIARAIVHQPKILFADEPTGNLDVDTAWEIIKLLKEINQQGTTIMVATHDREILESLSERVVSLKDGQVDKDSREEADKPDKQSKPSAKKKKKTTEKGKKDEQENKEADKK